MTGTLSNPQAGPGLRNCVNSIITPISLPLFFPVGSTVPLSRNRGSATRIIVGKQKDKILHIGIGVCVKDCSYSICT